MKIEPCQNENCIMYHPDYKCFWAAREDMCELYTDKKSEIWKIKAWDRLKKEIEERYNAKYQAGWDIGYTEGRNDLYYELLEEMIEIEKELE